MRVIITGGTGLIGKALSASLLADKHEVIVLSRNPSRYKDLPSGVKVEKWDAVSAEGWGHLVEEADAIVNLAGAGIADGKWSDKRKALLIDSRINAGKAVVEAVKAATNRPKVVVQASGIGYYGTYDNKNKLDENTQAGNDFPAEICKVWEPSTAAVTEMGVRHVIARIGIVLSTEGGALVELIKPFQMGAGGRLGGGMQWMSWIHIDDLVHALRYLISNPDAHGPYNLTAPAPVVNKVMAQKIGSILNTHSSLPAPEFVLKMVLGEMSTLVLDGQRVIPAKLTREQFGFKYTDVETALRNLLQPENV